jgi:hypothetical protein
LCVLFSSLQNIYEKFSNFINQWNIPALEKQ